MASDSHEDFPEETEDFALDLGDKVKGLIEDEESSLNGHPEWVMSAFQRGIDRDGSTYSLFDQSVVLDPLQDSTDERMETNSIDSLGSQPELVSESAPSRQASASSLLEKNTTIDNISESIKSLVRKESVKLNKVEIDGLPTKTENH